MAAPDDLARRQHHRQPRPTSHWGGKTDLTPHPGTVANCIECNPPTFKEHEPVDSSALPAFMTIVLLFGAAVKGCTLEEKAKLYAARQMLEEKRPLPEIGQAILDARGPEWAPDAETMAAIEAINGKG